MLSTKSASRGEIATPLRREAEPGGGPEVAPSGQGVVLGFHCGVLGVPNHVLLSTSLRHSPYGESFFPVQSTIFVHAGSLTHHKSKAATAPKYQP